MCVSSVSRSRHPGLDCCDRCALDAPCTGGTKNSATTEHYAVPRRSVIRHGPNPGFTIRERGSGARGGDPRPIPQPWRRVAKAVDKVVYEAPEFLRHGSDRGPDDMDRQAVRTQLRQDLHQPPLLDVAVNDEHRQKRDAEPGTDHVAHRLAIVGDEMRGPGRP